VRQATRCAYGLAARVMVGELAHESTVEPWPRLRADLHRLL